MKKTKKQIKKLVDKKCYFCGCDNYDLLDVHRLIPGEEGGKYTEWNMLTTCCMCHRKIHAGQIKIIGKHYSTTGRYILHYFNESGEEIWN